MIVFEFRIHSALMTWLRVSHWRGGRRHSNGTRTRPMTQPPTHPPLPSPSPAWQLWKKKKKKKRRHASSGLIDKKTKLDLSWQGKFSAPPVLGFHLPASRSESASRARRAEAVGARRAATLGRRNRQDREELHWPDWREEEGGKARHGGRDGERERGERERSRGLR